MDFTLALAGDTMLGRMVADRLNRDPEAELWAPEVRAIVARADRFVLNLECCVSDLGARWPDPYKPFFFRAPPVAAEHLRRLGVDAVTLANNHALDYGPRALLDTLARLDAAGIAHLGAGPDERAARRPLRLDDLAIVAFTDHPADFAAGPDHPGVAFTELGDALPGWIAEALRTDAPIRLATPHWGPNMTSGPIRRVRRTAEQLVEAGATLVAGHSAHVFHGVRLLRGPGGETVPVLYDLGDFIDDYATDPVLRNDLGLLWLVHFDGARPARIEAFPLKLDVGRTERATGADAAWILDRFVGACAGMGTPVRIADGRLVIDVEGVRSRAAATPPPPPPPPRSLGPGG